MGNNTLTYDKIEIAAQTIIYIGNTVIINDEYFLKLTLTKLLVNFPNKFLRNKKLETKTRKATKINPLN